MRTRWDKEKIKHAFKKYELTGKPLQAKKFRKDYGALYGAILYHFGSYKAFIEDYGLEYDQITDKKRWTDAKVIEEFKKLESSGHDINPKSISSTRVDLYAQIAERFGSYKSFIEMLGYNYKDICKRRNWTKDEIKTELLARVTRGESLTATVLLDEYFALYRASTNIFGSYKKALEYAGIKYTDAVGDFNTASTFGFAFESLVADMFLALDRNYMRHSREIEGIVPDFLDSENSIFVDAKLSSWTVFYSETIEKYSPHCEKLIIVYLRGPQIQRKVDGVEFRHISYYFDELRSRGLDEYIAKFSELLFSLEQAEKEAA